MNNKSWNKFGQNHPLVMQFLMFFIICNGVTILQMILMPVFKSLFGMTGLINTNFQLIQIGQNLNGSPHYIFDYTAGDMISGGGGLAYFLAVELTMAIAQVINFITQRNVTFKSTGNIWKAAFWYILAYIIITICAAALQGLYKTPLYAFAIQRFGTGTGTTAADVLTMLINSAISFWIFFPVMHIIFKQN